MIPSHQASRYPRANRLTVFRRSKCPQLGPLRRIMQRNRMSPFQGESYRGADIAKVSSLTQLRHWLCIAAKILMRLSAPINVLV